MENEQNLDLEQVNTEENRGTDTEAKAEEDVKKEFTPEQELAIKKRDFTRLAKDLGVEIPKKEEAKTVEKKEFNDTEQLFLDVKEVPEEDRNWLFEEHKTTGKPLRQLLGFKYVQETLKTNQESRKSENSLPEGKKRTGTAPKDSFDYWWAKVSTGVSVSEVPDAVIKKQIIEKRIADDRAGKGRQ